jgi:hypothetical protein
VRPSVFWVLWGLVFITLAACKGGSEGAGVPSPPASAPSVFLADAVGLCRETCAPRDAAWAASEVAGAMHLRCSCPPLSTLAPSKVNPSRATRAQRAASLQDSAGPGSPVEVAVR